MSTDDRERLGINPEDTIPGDATSDSLVRAAAMIAGVTAIDGKPPLTNFVGDKVARWKFTAACLGPECQDGKLHLGQAINLVHYLVIAIPQENEQTGKLEPAVYVVLSDGQQHPIAFWSPYVARDLGRMIQALGDDMWPNSVPVKVIQSDKPGKRSFYGLVPA